MMRTVLSIVAGLVVLTTGQAYADAPFCVVTGAGKQCYYYDAQSCYQAAESANGACVPNSTSRVSGSAPFCVQASYGTQCFYYDAQSCRDAAQAANAMCVTR